VRLRKIRDQSVCQETIRGKIFIASIQRRALEANSGRITVAVSHSVVDRVFSSLQALSQLRSSKSALENRNNRVFMQVAICLRAIPRLYGDARARACLDVESSRVVEVNSRLPIGSRAISYTTHARTHARTHACMHARTRRRSANLFIGVYESARGVRARARDLCGLSHVRRSRKRAITGTIRYIPGVLRVQQLYTRWEMRHGFHARSNARSLVAGSSATSTRFRDWEMGVGVGS